MESLKEMTNDFQGVEFIGEEITEEQKITLFTIINNEEGLKKKITFWLYNNNFMNITDTEELFYMFLSEFRTRPSWAFDYNFSEDEYYNPYYYIVSRLEYFLKKMNRELKIKLESELRIYEAEGSEGLPPHHIPLNVIERQNPEEDIILGLIDLNNVLSAIREIEDIIDFPVLDMYLVELDARLNSKTLRSNELSSKLNNNKVQEAKRVLKSRSEITLILKELISELIKICNDNALDIFTFCRVEL